MCPVAPQYNLRSQGSCLCEPPAPRQGELPSHTPLLKRVLQGGVTVQPLGNEQVKKQPGCGKASGKQVSVTWKLPANSPSCRGCPSQLHSSGMVLGRNAASVRMPLFCKSICRTFQCQISRRANAKCISPSSRSSKVAGAIEFHSFHLYYKYCIVVSFFSLILSLEKNYKALVDWSLWLSTVVKPQAVNTSFNCLRRMYLFHWNNWMKSVRSKESPPFMAALLFYLWAECKRDSSSNLPCEISPPSGFSLSA